MDKLTILTTNQKEPKMTDIIEKIETEFNKVEDDVKLDYKKVMAILRAHFGGDHPVIADMKKLAGEPASPELSASIGGVSS